MKFKGKNQERNIRLNSSHLSGFFMANNLF